MRIQYKHQKFQADAAKAVVDVFAGQPYLTPSYMMDRGYGQISVDEVADFLSVFLGKMFLCHLEGLIDAFADGNAGDYDDEFAPTIGAVQFVHCLYIGICFAHSGLHFDR